MTTFDYAGFAADVVASQRQDAQLALAVGWVDAGRARDLDGRVDDVTVDAQAATPRSGRAIDVHILALHNTNPNPNTHPPSSAPGFAIDVLTLTLT